MMSPTVRRQLWAILGFAVAVLLLMALLRSDYYELVLTQVLLWAMMSVAWSLGVGITAVAGGLVAGLQSFQPYTGFDFVIVMYAGVVLGGLGSILGAFWGGLLIGIVQQMSTLVLPYQLQNTAIFVVFLLIIFLRPQGMFGRLSERT